MAQNISIEIEKRKKNTHICNAENHASYFELFCSPHRIKISDSYSSNCGWNDYVQFESTVTYNLGRF